MSIISSLTLISGRKTDRCISTVKRRLEIHRSFIGQLPSDLLIYGGSSSIGTGPNGDDIADSDNKHNGSYLARIRRVYEALQRIQSQKKKQREEEEKKQRLLRKSYAQVLTDPAPHPAAVLNSNMNDEARDSEEPFSVPDSRNPEATRVLTDTQLSRYLNVFGALVPAKDQVHRIKVDERNGFFLVTNRSGGLVVRDVESGSVLWDLPKVCFFQSLFESFNSRRSLFFHAEPRPPLRPPRVRKRVHHLRPSEW